MNHPSGRLVYIYVLKDPRVGLARYVGWTIKPKRRLADHIKLAKNGKEENHRAHWIRSLLRDGIAPVMEIIESGVVDFAERERWWIRHYRSIGAKLTNGTDGGEGVTGHIKSAATRKKLSIANMGRPSLNKGLKHTPEAKAKMSLIRFGKHPSKSTRLKISAAMKNRILSPESYQKAIKTRRQNTILDSGSACSGLYISGFAGRWKLLERVEGKPNYWKCVCACGVKRNVNEQNLASGISKSCGCLWREIQSKPRSYGECGRGSKKTTECRAWQAMIAACSIRSSANWATCGARGVSVCRKWKKSYPEFLSYVGRRPDRGYCLIRIDKNKNFEPGNVRWATSKDKARIASHGKRYKFNGKSLLLTEWSEVTGLSVSCLFKRFRRGWLASRALTEPSSACKAPRTIA